MGSEDDLEGGEGAQPRTLDLFISPKTLKSVLEATALEPGSLSIVGVLARQLPQAAAKIWSSERHRRRLIAQAVSSATVESEDGEEHGWTRQLLRGTMHKSCQAFVQQELEDLLKTLEDSTARVESEDEEDEEDDPILMTNRAAGAPPGGAASLIPSPLPEAARAPQHDRHDSTPTPVATAAPSRPMEHELLAQLMRSMVEAVRGQAGRTEDAEGARVMRALRQALPAPLQLLLDEAHARATGAASTTAGHRAAAMAALDMLEAPTREVGEPEHAVLGATVRTPGECAAYVANTVSGRAGAVGLQGVLLASSALEGQQAAEFLVQLAEKGLERVGLEA